MLGRPQWERPGKARKDFRAHPAGNTSQCVLGLGRGVAQLHFQFRKIIGYCVGNGSEKTNLGTGKPVPFSRPFSSALLKGTALLQEEKMLAAPVSTVVSRTGEHEEAAQRSEVKLTRWTHGRTRRERRK